MVTCDSWLIIAQLSSAELLHQASFPTEASELGERTCIIQGFGPCLLRGGAGGLATSGSKKFPLHRIDFIVTKLQKDGVAGLSRILQQSHWHREPIPWR